MTKATWEKRLEQIENERSDGKAGESLMALPCLTCGYSSANSPCDKCGRFKW